MDKHDGIDVDVFEVNVNNMDEIEFNLTELAHKLSMEKGNDVDGDSTSTIGRCLKHFIPSYINFLTQERGRQAPHGPGTALYSMVRAFALLTAIWTLASARHDKEEEALKQLPEMLGALFHVDLAGIIEDSYTTNDN